MREQQVADDITGPSVKRFGELLQRKNDEVARYQNDIRELNERLAAVGDVSRTSSGALRKAVRVSPGKRAGRVLFKT